MNRRKFLIAAGAIITAEGLWIPGQKLISIPKKLYVFGDTTTEFIGSKSSVLWPGVEKWFYDKYYNEVVIARIPYQDFYSL